MTDSDKSYLVYMAARILEMHRVLKPTGSIYLHCDPTMSHYLKLIMDGIFGRQQFRNEIVWCYRGGGAPKMDFGRRHDIVFRYSKSPKLKFFSDAIRIPYQAEGISRTDDAMWGKHKGTNKIYKPHPLGKVPEDWWLMNILNANDPERTGYPTQKPLKLLGRIIAASSSGGDVILDPFCGCATTLVAAEELGRQWVGIDISPKAADLVRQRLKGELDLLYKGARRTDIPQRTDLGAIPRYNSLDNRRKLYGLQEGNCAGCSSHFESRHLEVDHIISQGKGGTAHIENLQLLCGNCNRIKGDRGMEYLKVKLQIR